MNPLAILLVLCFIHVSCTAPKPTGSTVSEVLYKEAVQLFSEKRYLLATEKLNLIRSKYPYSYYATHAELLNADILYAQKNFEEAAAAYLVFKDFHPKHKRLPYVIYRAADSFYHQLPSTYDRDLTPGFEAIKYYKELMKKYPKSAFIKDVRVKIAECRQMIQNKERYIADFYFKTKSFKAARYRYLSILDNFAQNKEIRDHAIIRIFKSSKALNDKNFCKKYYTKYKRLTSRLKDLEKAYSKCLN